MHNIPSAVPDLRVDQQVCFALYAASRATSAAYRQALEEVGLTYPQYLVMLALWEDDGLTVGQLGRRLQLDSGTLSPLVRRLASHDLVTRSRPDRDARRVVVRLTGRGHALRAEAERIQGSLLARLDLPVEDLVLLRDLAHRLIASLHAPRQEAADTPGHR